jgi:pteridine reductase
VDLWGKTAIVTGSAVRLGKAIALGLSEAGARLVIHYGSSAKAAHEVVDQIERLGRSAVAIQADLSQVTQARHLLDRALTVYGQVDVLVNSASIFEPGSWDSTTESSWDRHFAINLKSPFFLAQAFAGQVKPGQRGHVVNIADWRALHPGTDHVAYTLTKAALVTMTEILAQGLAPNIQVNAIAPGMILPPPGQGLEFFEQHASEIPAQRPGSPAEIVKTLLYLLDTDFVTGELVYVTGGEHLLAGRPQ